MTVTNSINKSIFAGNGAQTAFTFTFNAGYAQGAPSPATALSYLTVIATDSSGNQTTVAQGSGANQCQITLNAPVAGALWGQGGTINYNPNGTPLPAGSTLTVLRTVPLTQLISLSNQGGLFPQTVEMAMDLLEFQIQQLSEAYGRALVAPAVDANAPLPLPAAAQRANLALLFDGNGNPIAGAAPSSGVISSAMQPVVNAATIAAGRTALGLGAMATEGIGAGLQDDGSGNARVLPPLQEVSSNQAIHKTAHTSRFMASGTLVFTLDRASTLLFPGFEFYVYALTGPITFAIDSNDNFFGQTSGVSYTIPKGCSARISTDALAAATWYAEVSGISPKVNVQIFTANGTYTPSAGLLFAVGECAGGGGGGGGCQGAVGSVVSGGGGQGGAYARIVLTAVQIGASQAVTVGTGGVAGGITGTGGTGGTSSLGTLCSAAGGAGGSAGTSSTIAGGGSGAQSVTGTVTVQGEDGATGCLASITTVFLPSGKGGNSVLGFGGAAVITNGSAGISGKAGKNYGGGGSGATENNNNAGGGGGAGAPGIVIVTEYLAAAA